MIKRLLLTLVTGLLLAGTTVTAAHAEDGYRFWGYYQWTAGKWAFASSGPDKVVPADGAVEGWRFAVAPESIVRTPRADGDFGAICAAAPAESGKKRVALVIDGGTPQDAPSGTPPAPKGVCVVTDPAATGAKVLAAAAQVRIEKGLTCAVDGYPASGCGDPVKNPDVPAKDDPVQLQIAAPVGSSAPRTATPLGASAPRTGAEGNDSSAWTTIVPIAVIVVLLAGGAFIITRRRRSTTT
jgi:hypothetical protein